MIILFSCGAAQYSQPRVEAEGRNPGLTLRLNSKAPKGRSTSPLSGLCYSIWPFFPGFHFVPPWAAGTPSLRDFSAMMQLKTYQETCIHALRDYFSALKDDTGHSRPPSVAWKAVSGSTKEYQSLDDSRGYSVPFVCVQVPTGGGKTLLAAHTVDIAKEFVTPTNTGLVLWIVPTNQIYTQTYKALNTRDPSVSSGSGSCIRRKDKDYSEGGQIHPKRRGRESCRTSDDDAIDFTAIEGVFADVSIIGLRAIFPERRPVRPA